jgi:hypothetical protein
MDIVNGITVAPLDPSRHRSTRLGPFPDFSFAREQQHAIIGFNEIALAAADYPLVLMKHAETGRFNVVALYGFAVSRNLYVAESHWHATYIPQSSLRYPFTVSAAGVLGLAIDERSELIGDPNGRRLFDDAGRPTDYIMQVAKTLQWLRQDFEAMLEFAQVLAQLSVVKPLSLVLRMQDASEQQIDGLYTISDPALASLPDRDVLMLHRRGFLRAVSILVASLAQLNRLQHLHDAQSAVRIANVAIALRE